MEGKFNTNVKLTMAIKVKIMVSQMLASSAVFWAMEFLWMIAFWLRSITV